MTKRISSRVFGLLARFQIACSSGRGRPTPGTAGTTGAGTAGANGGGGTTATAGTTGAGGTNPVVVTPMGTLLMDDFESGAAKWMVTQGTCMVVADSAADGGTS